MTPEIVLPALQWVAVVTLSCAVVGGMIAGYLDYRRDCARARARAKAATQP
jgi:hypothetical protein